jgi:hypothetical protein
MAREMSPTAARVFRAVTVATWPSGRIATTVHGPYARKADASRMVTREKGSWCYLGATTAGWVEAAAVEWQREGADA